MASNFTVIYDACVLYPAPLRDLLMQLALSDRFRARWSNTIHDEWIRNLIKNRPDINPSALERTRDLMNSNVRDCLVEGFEYLIPSIDLPDKDDRHVVAAAIHSGAETIITFNLKDFPIAVLSSFNLEAKHPDDFILDLFDLHPASVLEALTNQRKSLKTPSKSVDEFLDILLQQGLTQTVSMLKDWKGAF